MKRSVFSGMRVVLASAAVAFLASISLTGCMSSGESTDPDAAVEAPAEAGENAAAPANEAGATDASNVSGVEGGSGEQTANAAGGELQNLVNEGSANAAATPAEGAAANNAPAGNDPFAAALNNAAPAAEGNPAAEPAAAAAPAEAPATNVAADPFAPADGGANATAAAAPVDPAAAAAPAPVDAAAAAPADPAAAPAPTNAAAAPAAPDNSIPPAPDAQVASSSASAMPEGGALPESGSKMPYYIKKGDTLAKIAGLIYGDASKWKSLAEENNLKNPSLIYAGDVILYTLTEKSQGFAQKYEAAPRSTVKVARGDTLSSLASKVFGSQGEWRTLWKMNPQVKNPDVIKEGMVLVYREITKVAATDGEEVLVGMSE